MIDTNTTALDEFAEESSDNPGLIGSENQGNELDPNQSKSVLVEDEDLDETGDMPVRTPENEDMESAMGHAPEPDDAGDIDEMGESVGLYNNSEDDEETVKPLNVTEEVAAAEQAAWDEQPE